MRISTAHILGIKLTVSLLVSAATASELFWTFQQVAETVSNPRQGLGLEMRTGNTWPTVFYEGRLPQSGEEQLIAAALTPAGWSYSGFGTSNSSSNGPSIHSASRSDGNVGVVYSNNPQATLVQSSAQGWQTLALPSPAGQSNNPQEPLSLAYLSNDLPVTTYYDDQNNDYRLAVNDGLGWQSQVIEIPGRDNFSEQRPRQFTTLAVDSQDNLGIAFLGNDNSIYFAAKSPLSGPWTGTEVNDVLDPINLSLAFGANDEPGLAILTENRELYYASFNVQTGLWEDTLIGTGIASQRVNLEFDSAGNPALAYVDDNDLLHYRINEGSGWVDHILPWTDNQDPQAYRPSRDSEAALAFDGSDLPVIAYYSDRGELLLAYDPIIIPEPSSLVMLLGSVMVLFGRRR